MQAIFNPASPTMFSGITFFLSALYKTHPSKNPFTWKLVVLPEMKQLCYNYLKWYVFYETYKACSRFNQVSRGHYQLSGRRIRCVSMILTIALHAVTPLSLSNLISPSKMPLLKKLLPVEGWNSPVHSKHRVLGKYPYHRNPDMKNSGCQRDLKVMKAGNATKCSMLM